MSTTRPIQPAAPDKELIVERADKITPKKLRWLWPQRIPLGKVTIFAGIPGEGKSLVTIDVAARVTTGRDYPDLKNPLEPGEALFISGEDDPEDALAPRLITAGADLSKVHIVRSVRDANLIERDLRLDEDLETIKQYLRRFPEIRFLVVDPISNHLGRAHMVAEQEIRQLLRPLQGVAQAHGIAVVCVMHLNKKEGLAAINRVAGAGAFIGLARASWLFGRDKENPSEHLMVPLKNNYAKETIESLSYCINEQPVKIEGDDEPIPHVEWGNGSNVSAEELLEPAREHTSRAEAKTFLETFLAQGPRDASEVYARAKKEGISKRTLERAKAELRVDSRKVGIGTWEWVLPTCREAEDGVPTVESQSKVAI